MRQETLNFEGDGMRANNGNSPAMPQEWASYVEADPVGLTKREHFAALVLQGFAADPDIGNEASVLAKHAVAWADALLEELEKS